MSPEKSALEGLRIERRPEAPASSGRRRGAWIALVLLLAVAAAAALWIARPSAAPVRVAAVREAGGAAAGAVLNATGYVTARRQATVSSKVTGKVVDVRIEEGMAVRQGDVLARLDALTQNAALALAEAQLDEARRTLAENEVRVRQSEITRRRQHALLAGGAGTQSDTDSADADADAFAARLALGRQQVEVAERQVAVRRQDLDDTVIRAPFAGVITTKDAQPGEMISPISAGGGFTRTGIGTLVDMASLEIDVDVSENYINRVTPGQPADAVLDAYPDWHIPVKVLAVVPSADRQKATVKVRLSFDHLDPRILPDMGVKVAFLAAGSAASSSSHTQVVVPRAALHAESGGQVVFVLHGDRVERRAVRTAAAAAPGQGSDAVVLAGLTPGEQVVVEGPADLSDGRKVVVR
jgi:HlyD family secretion protein